MRGVALAVILAALAAGCAAPAERLSHLDLDGDGVAETWIRWRADETIEIVEPVPDFKEGETCDQCWFLRCWRAWRWASRRAAP